jgi:hypothetical protein
MTSDTANLRAIIALFEKLGLDPSVEHLEQFEQWLVELSDLELSAIIEFLSRRLARRFENNS